MACLTLFLLCLDNSINTGTRYQFTPSLDFVHPLSYSPFGLPLMEMLAPASSQAQTRTVPLVCIICPRKPNFSDLSHLLTHISSKAHLSTYYKLKVRSGSDDAARQSVERYDIWYAENDIESFMSERMKHKDERKKIKIELHTNVKVIKKESHSPTFTPSSASYDDIPSVYPHPYAAYAPMYTWAAHPYLTHRQDSASVENDDQQAPSEVSLIPRKRKVKHETHPVGDVDDEDESSKLKGIVWPGMGLFDAATPELKKKRNQKKDVSVNDRLATMSGGIMKEELIFSASGTLLKTRIISGQPQPEDLLPGEELPPRQPKAKRAPRKKPLDGKKPLEDKKPLGDRDLGTATKPNLRAKPKARKNSRKQRPVLATTADTQEGIDPKDAVPRKTTRNKRKKAPFDEAEEEGETQIEMEEATFEQPVVMTQLNSGYQHAPMYVAAAPMGFRAAEPTYMNMTGQSYYQFPAGQDNPFSYDPSPLTTWDYFGYGVGSSVVNPLFTGMYGGSFDDDDDDEDNEGTISAPISESQ
ncbi:unnamed protein product [Aureobasidium uvarum]|uniref:Uncharacterized protein n=1 Tax=Aureobasidium uvarum TaxID=2773716 RepID=A0A9N8PUM5_9PEZI|nr:unnamed protein product [Aureobasidium uvarum]